jgi:hypothetical protein
MRNVLSKVILTGFAGALGFALSMPAFAENTLNKTRPEAALVHEQVAADDATSERGPSSKEDYDEDTNQTVVAPTFDQQLIRGRHFE